MNDFMKNLITIVFALSPLFSFTQHLNKIGKIELEEIPSMQEYRIQKLDNVYKVVKDSFILDGNTYFKIPNGYITSLQLVDNKKDYIKHYNSEGVLLVTIMSDKIINLKVSEKGNKVVFNNSKNIILINLNGYKLDTLADSYVYEFVQKEKLIYYNPANKSIYFNDVKIASEEYPNQFIDYKGKILVITKQYIYELAGNNLIPEYEFRGEFFDLRLVDGDLYFVDREEERKSESFSLYKTSDFTQIILVDRIDELNN